MGVYKLYLWDMNQAVGRCWAESLEEANHRAIEMFGVGGWAMEDDNDEAIKRAS